jgi:hypothetical protein
VRTVFAALGAAALIWGGWLAVDLVAGSTGDGVQVAAFVVGGPLVHDLVVAPAVGLTGLLIARRVPIPWRTPVALGAAATGVLVILALPLLWRPYGVAANPGLHDRDYPAGVAAALAAVWIAVAVTGTVSVIRARRRAVNDES